MDTRIRLFVVAAMLAGLAPAGAGVFTVGPGGTYATIQAAVDAAIAAGGNNDVKVRPGTYAEHLFVPSSFVSGNLMLSGGWNAAFTQRSNDPALTVVDGSGSGRVLEVRAAGGTVVVVSLTLTHGAGAYGAGVLVELAGAAGVIIGNCRIADNVATAYSTGEGGGLYLYAPAGATIEVIGNVVEGNLASATDGSATGGGLFGVADGDGTLAVVANRIRGNTCHTAASNNSDAAGAYLVGSDAAVVELSDNDVTGNHSTGEGTTSFTGAFVGAAGSASTVVMRRNRIWNNTSSKPGPVYFALGVYVHDASTAVVSDTVVAGSAGDGVSLQAIGAAQLEATNLTVVDIAGCGLRLQAQPTASVSLYNTVEWSTGAPDSVSGPVTMGNNLTDSDPLFVGAAAGNYELGAGSPAIGVGSNTAPGLGATDLAGGERVIGANVDAGAYEYGNIFSDGFEYFTSARWSTTQY
jgi:hypothetical protein